MNKFTKYAQAAVETLLIYGVTILIVMLAIGALIGFGVIDLGKLLPDKCDITNTFTCENYVVSTTAVKFELSNRLGKNIDFINITVKGIGDNEGLWQCEPLVYLNNDPEESPPNDANNGVLVNGVVSDVMIIPCNIQVPSGKKITGVIKIQFEPVSSSLKGYVEGDIRATVS